MIEPKQNDGSGFWGIFIIFKHKGQYKELLVGHLSEINVKVGDTVSMGQNIGLEGNKGTVFVGPIEVTKAMQDAGDKRGSHRHYQTRLIKRVERSNQQCLTTTNSFRKYRDEEGLLYEIIDYYKGYHGCVDCQDILDEYEEWKLIHTSVPIKLENVIMVQKTFLEVLKNVYEHIINLVKN